MDANTKFDIFYDQISQFINSHVPCRKLSEREIELSTTPWITKPILAKIRIEMSSIPKSLGVAALESRTWHPNEFRCYSQEKEKNLNRQIFPLSPNNL